MSSLTIFAVGGAGINGVDLWLSSGQSQRLRSNDITVIGVDTSTNNLPKLNKFEMEHMEGARGGGKVLATNYEAARPFVKDILSRRKPGDFTIVVYSLAGSTGGLFGPMLVRQIMEMGKPVLSIIIADQSSNIELGNTSKGFKTLDNQRRQLDLNVMFDMVRNDRYETRGKANEALVSRLDYASIFLTDQYEESDHEDIKNLFFVNRVTKTPSSLIKVNYYIDPENLLEEADGNIVAAMSLYRDGNDITSGSTGLAYRTTGVIDADVGPKNMKSIHMTLDQGETVKEIRRLIEEYDESQTQAEQRFRPTESLSATGGDEHGVEL